MTQICQRKKETTLIKEKSNIKLKKKYIEHVVMKNQKNELLRIEEQYIF